MLNTRDFSGKVEPGGRLIATLAANPSPKPDLEAHRKATTAEFPDIVQGLVSIIGRKLTAYIASVKDTRAIDRWLTKAAPQHDVEQRLRLAYHVAAMLSSSDSSAVVQAWLLGLNPELDDDVPIRLLREGDLQTDGKRILGAARAFLVGG
jgi:hypothetical protein